MLLWLENIHANYLEFKRMTLWSNIILQQQVAHLLWLNSSTAAVQPWGAWGLT